MNPRAALPLIAAALVTLGAGIPLVMMVNGALALEIDYEAWTWPAIPAVWAPSIAGAWLAAKPQKTAAGALLLCLGAAAGAAIFWRELGLLTFGPAWLIGGWLYLDAGRRAGLLRRHPVAATTPE